MLAVKEVPILTTVWPGMPYSMIEASSDGPR